MQKNVSVTKRLRRWLGGTVGKTPRGPSPEAVYNAAAAAAALARDYSDWPEVVRQLRIAASVRPHSGAVRVQIGHALKESGRLAEAEAAYREACVLDAHSGDARFQLGVALRLQGRDSEAVDAFVSALEIDPLSTGARSALIELGARRDLSSGQFGRGGASVPVGRIAQAISQLGDGLSQVAAASIYPVEAWSAFRAEHPVLPPPPIRSAAPKMIVVDADGAAPWQVLATLRGLIDQSLGDWRALVIADDQVISHPVASLAWTDARVRFVTVDQARSALLSEASDGALLVMAGVVLDPQALAWFAFAAEKTSAAALYADHDHHLLDWREGYSYCEPVLLAAGAFAFCDISVLPALQIGKDALLGWISDFRFEDKAARVSAMSKRIADDAVHIPRLLSSIRLAPGTRADVSSSMLARAASLPSTERILVIIPTRDQFSLLDTSVRSIKSRSARPDLVDIVVMDNRSGLTETSEGLSRLQREGLISCEAADQPFNWSQINNRAAASAEHALLVFANNDIEMLSDGWDDRVRSLLLDDRIGIVGARLLYPDSSLQHAGIALGAINGRPFHEGRGALASDNGPLGRWRATRAAAAVTGAFMAVRRSVFEAAEGFEEALSIAYNDVDFCLRVRSLGYSVVLAGDIEAIHHESKSRGVDVTPDKTSWDDTELHALYRTWGRWTVADPYVNPHWTFTERLSFDGVRDLSTSQVVEWLAAGTRPERPQVS